MIPASPAETNYIKAMSRDQVVGAYSAWTVISEAEAMCLDVAFEPGARVLDLGCGAGRFARSIGHMCGSYLGVDASAQMVNVARRICPKLTFVVGDIVDFTAKDASYDIVLLTGNVLDYLHPESRRRHLLMQCRSWLRPGGTIFGSSHLTKSAQPRGFYLEDYYGVEVNNFRASLSELVAEVENYGYEVIVAARDYRVVPADWANWVARADDVTLRSA